jgi:hypothetical protein
VIGLVVLGLTGFGQVAFGECSTVLAALVALVFTTAAVMKLGDRPDAIGTFGDMGFVKNPASRSALVLFAGVVGLELAVAVALVVVPPLGGVLGLVLLATFTAVLARTARTRPTVRCACFGSVSQRPIGFATFVRNALLMLALVPAVGRLFAGVSLRPTWGLGSVFFGAGAALVGSVVVALSTVAQDSRVRSLASLNIASGSTVPVTAPSSNKPGLKAAS